MEILRCTTDVIIEGNPVLRFMELVDNGAFYEIVGFENQRITLFDYRPTGLAAIQKLLNGGDLYAFAPAFNTPADLTINQNPAGGYTIHLFEPTSAILNHVFWIKAGIRGSVPVYHYCFRKIAPLSDSSYSYLSVFQKTETSKSIQFQDCLVCSG